MIIDHVCYAVKNTCEAIVYWKKVFGYEQMTETIVNARQKVKVTFLKKEGSLTIKLIEPLEENHSLQKFVAGEGGIHHICFRCSDINEEIEELTSRGLRLLTPPQPGEAFNNKNIAFLFGRYGMNIELIDTDEKAGML